MTKTYRYYLRDGIPRRETIRMQGDQVFMHTDPFNAQTDTEITEQEYHSTKAQRRDDAATIIGNAKAQSQALFLAKRDDMVLLKAELEGLGVSSQLLWVLD